MKSKILALGLVLAVLFSLSACKSKESAYKAAYEAAKEKETTEVQTLDEVTPVEKQKTSSVPVVSQKEKVTALNYNEMKKFSVILGSFMNKTNATSLQDVLSKQGYNSFIMQNERGMYRVAAATFDNKSDAAGFRDEIKSLNYPDKYQDAWILEQD